MTGCYLVRTTMRTIYGKEIVDWNFAEGGGITDVNRQILTGSTEAQIMAKGSIGIPGKVTFTQ